MPKILDTGGTGCWSQWMLEILGVGAGNACYFIIVC